MMLRWAGKRAAAGSSCWRGSASPFRAAQKNRGLQEGSRANLWAYMQVFLHLANFEGLTVWYLSWGGIYIPSFIHCCCCFPWCLLLFLLLLLLLFILLFHKTLDYKYKMLHWKGHQRWSCVIFHFSQGNRPREGKWNEYPNVCLVQALTMGSARRNFFFFFNNDSNVFIGLKKTQSFKWTPQTMVHAYSGILPSNKKEQAIDPKVTKMYLFI